eukprot:TRINITY_DN12295_c0_g2_i3.p1 TRINITY_DN12295_c0_g2~~TRINITY_DN12295_c0_g2_i3.p1  ORF type:complete len:929 (+),score=195.71 TRINITY_DN12295_c0_g2_i3:388-2787(+)
MDPTLPPCPTGVTCICQPCIVGDPIVLNAMAVRPEDRGTMFTEGYNFTVADFQGFASEESSTPCQRVEACLTVEQRADVIVTVTHFDLEVPVSEVMKEHEILIGIGENDDITDVPMAPIDMFGAVLIQHKFTRVGSARISVLYRGDHVPQSPFFIEVVPRTCELALEKPDAQGDCVCVDDALRIGGGCVAAHTVAVPISLGLLLAIVGVVYFLIAQQRAKFDRDWQIDEKELVFDPKGDNKLGEGAFANVEVALYRNIRVAVKTLKKTSGALKMNGGQGGSKETTRTQATGSSKSSNKRQAFIQEMRTMAKLRHPCITTTLGAVINGPQLKLIMECMEGTLKDLLRDASIDLDLDVKLSFIRDTASGMSFIHAQRPALIHGDLKPSNLLVDSNLRIKISDFGLTSHLSQQGAGSLAFMAPELLNGGWTSPETDAYAFAIVMAEVISRRPAYNDMHLDQLKETVGDIFHQPPVRPIIDREGVPDVIVSMMERCWDNNPQVRLEFAIIDQQLQAMDIGGIGKSLFTRSADRKKQAALLNQFFPPVVADCLRAGKKFETRVRDILTVVYLEVEDFDRLPELLKDDAALARVMRSYHQAVDEACIAQGMFKMPDQGSTIMCVGNLLSEQPFHLISACKLLDKIFEATNDLHVPDVGSLRLRAAVHCGSATETVVGTSNPRYCLLGDTINACQALLSMTASGRVTMSWLAATMLQAQCASRGLHLDDQLTDQGESTVPGYGRIQLFDYRVPSRRRTLQLGRENPPSAILQTTHDKDLVRLTLPLQHILSQTPVTSRTRLLEVEL